MSDRPLLYRRWETLVKVLDRALLITPVTIWYSDDSHDGERRSRPDPNAEFMLFGLQVLGCHIASDSLDKAEGDEDLIGSLARWVKLQAAFSWKPMWEVRGV